MDEDVRCLFSGRVERRDGDYVVEIPASEVELGTLEEGAVYRFGARSAAGATDPDATDGSTEGAAGADADDADADGGTGAGGRTGGVSGSGSRSRRRGPDEPPVETGELREVEIEDLGEQGDGLARVGPGYVVFVPDAGVGERVRVRITDVRDNFAFAEIAER